MEFYRVWRILVGYKWLLIWLPIVATFGSLAVTYVLPEQYESTALVLVQQFKDIKFNTSGGDRNEYLDFPVNLSAPIDAPSKTYIEVIKSPAVAVQIVETLHLDAEKPKHYAGLLDEIKDKVKTWVSDTSRSLLNYLKYGRDIPASRFDLAVENIEKKLAVASRKDTYAFEITYRSSDPKEAAGVANIAAEIFLEQRAEAYRTESTRTREFIEKQLDDSRKALEEARIALLAYKDAGSTFDLTSEYKEKLKNQSDLENTLAKAEGKLAGLKRTPLSPKGSADLIEQGAIIADLKEKIAALQGQLNSYPKKETRLNHLILTQRLAQDTYEFFLKRYEEARVKEAAQITEIRIASRAVASLYPVRPVKYIYVLISFGTALLLAIGWALFAESLDPRVRSLDDLSGELGLPVLGAIPAGKRSW
jgi:uncharacterized protein involved in exopolysaccharide biosynthesis